MDRDWLGNFTTMTTHEQITWLSRFVFLMTMFARDTYDLDSSGLRDGAAMRKYNEFSHRLSSHLLKVVTGNEDRMPDEVFIRYISDALSELKSDEEYLRKQLG